MIALGLLNTWACYVNSDWVPWGIYMFLTIFVGGPIVCFVSATYDDL